MPTMGWTVDEDDDLDDDEEAIVTSISQFEGRAAITLN